MSRTSIACAIVALCCMSPFARAVTTVYTTLGAFNAAAPGTTLQTFDSGVTGPAPVTVGAVTISDPNGGDTVFLSNATFGSGLSATLSTGGPPPTIQFAFSSSINAVAFDLFDLGTVGGTTLSFLLSNGDTGIIAGPGFTGSTGNALFYGFKSSSLFNTISFTNTQPGDFLEFDNARYGIAAASVVPLPAAAWLGFVLIGGIGAKRATRKAKDDLTIA